MQIVIRVFTLFLRLHPQVVLAGCEGEHCLVGIRCGIGHVSGFVARQKLALLWIPEETIGNRPEFAEAIRIDFYIDHLQLAGLHFDFQRNLNGAGDVLEVHYARHNTILIRSRGRDHPSRIVITLRLRPRSATLRRRNSL
ncbi:hypothetical protein 21_00094 [Pseudomonas phage Epa21]|uniref:Uncharacterized protein n=1 Tax=Pseudomonas phage Epa21 TaxID=2719191 RepID=A0A6G9LIL8_9CAUD|nr:hypothetical protein 21_00094 [Pseudomonas phage Epa21]